MTDLKVAYSAPVTDLLRQDWYASMRCGGAVKRCHVFPIIGENLVAGHSWGVALLIQRLWPDSGKNLIMAALTHDVPEYLIGDMPADAKWRNPALRTELKIAEASVVAELGIDWKLTATEERRLNFADRLELMWFCVEQRRLGNRNVEVVYDRLHDWLQQQTDQDIPVIAMLRDLNKLYSEASK